MDPVIIFLGTPGFALPTLTALNNHFTVTGVVTQPDRPAGRGRKILASPVKQLALELELEIYQPQNVNAQAALNQLRLWDPDLIVVAAFGQILKTDILSLPRYGCINVHASLLPRWRGAAPINAAILNKDKKSGVTIMKMDSGLDSGPILTQRAIPIQPEDTAGTLYTRLAAEGADLLVRTIPPYLAGEIQPEPQDNSEATYAPRLSREDGFLDFMNPAEFLARQVRAYHPWPGTFTIWKDRRVIIHQAHAVDVTTPGVGVFTIHEGQPAIGTHRGLLVIDQLQPAGKKIMSGEDFLHGNPDWAEDHHQINHQEG